MALELPADEAAELATLSEIFVGNATGALADEPLGLQRYRDVVAQLRAGRLPRDEEDLIADRRERVIF